MSSSGIQIDGAKLTLRDSAGGHAANIYVDTSGRLRLDPSAWSGGVYVQSLNATYGIDSGTYIKATSYLYPAPHSSQPLASDGALVYDPSDGYMKYFSLHDNLWFRIQRTGGWS